MNRVTPFLSQRNKGDDCASSASQRRGMWRALACVAGLAFSGNVIATSLDIGGMAPNFTLKSVKGENLRLGEYAGNVRAVIFTASWCGTCNDALEALQTLHPKMQQYGYESWAIYLGSDAAKVRDVAHHLDLSYPMLIDEEGRVARRYWIDDLPALFLIDRDGRIRDVLEGDEVSNTVRIADTLKRIAEE